jgi:hypothetical protein
MVTSYGGNVDFAPRVAVSVTKIAKRAGRNPEFFDIVPNPAMRVEVFASRYRRCA